ncbi:MULTISPECIES: trypsin-like peptidase domain-containing protein [unclassified Nocardioides]|uniref:trypsin-like peptidase domain-containing protein n=1 Tax=unclassified Nocardioides TaxID=2615069 RepID=UPI003618E2E2
MSEYLDDTEIDALTEIIGRELALDPQLRPILFERVHRDFLGVLPYNAKPTNQVRSDLVKMNRVERLSDGSVPLQQWLRAAAGQVQDATERAVVDQALDKVTAAAAGEPSVEAVAAVVESKELVIFRDDMVAFDFLELGALRGRSVGRITVAPWSNGAPVVRPGGAVEPHAGTCWLIAPNLVVTNHHVVNARAAVAGPAPQVPDTDLADQAAHAVVNFDYVTNASEGPSVACTGLVAWSRELDYAVVSLEAPTDRDPLPLYEEPLEVSLDDHVAVNIIQHPDGRAKRVGLRNNLIHQTTERDVNYFTDTKTGSSGSPVLTDDWRVCALHRGSQSVKVQFQGKSSAYINVGTQIHAILDDLRTRYPDVAAQVALAAPGSVTEMSG